VRERRAEVGIALAHEREGALLRDQAQAAITRAAALARCEGRRAAGRQPPGEPSNLARTQPEPLRGPPLGQPPRGELRQHFQALQFLHGQRHHPRDPSRREAKRTFLLWRNRTFAFGAYKPVSEMKKYVPQRPRTGSEWTARKSFCEAASPVKRL
jgi:hypothetical protein